MEGNLHLNLNIVYGKGAMHMAEGVIAGSLVFSQVSSVLGQGVFVRLVF